MNSGLAEALPLMLRFYRLLSVFKIVRVRVLDE